MVCCSLSIERPPQNNKSLFTPPAVRSSSSQISRRKIEITRPNNKFMSFNCNEDYDGMYMKKLKSFLDFLFKVNYSNNIYVCLSLSSKDESINTYKYKAYIGTGNNSLLIKSLLKRRFWIEIVENIDTIGINFYWTQNKSDELHKKQNSYQSS